MSQIGAEDTSTYPATIDTRMICVNAPNAAPKSASRIDSSWMNSLAHAIINIEHTLGAMPHGSFGSVAARLQQFNPGGGITPALFGFASQTTYIVPGTTHRLGSATLRAQLYDTSVPAQAIQADAVTIDQTTYDVTVTFVSPQSGLLILHGGAPQYVTTFTDELSLLIPGATHQLGTGVLLATTFTNEDPLNILAPATVTIDQGNFDVTVTFESLQSGSLILSAAGPRYYATFTDKLSVDIPGATHQLNTRALLWAVFDDGDPMTMIDPNSLTVDPATFNVTVTFLTPQSGSILLVRSSEITGSDFEIRDAGITDATATRVRSTAGTLHLQFGSGDALLIENKFGTVVAQMDATGNLGLGVDPAYQLQLTQDSAAKPSTNTWTIASDARLKEVLRPFTDSLNVLLALEPVWYRYNGLGGMPTDGQEHVGFVAQALQGIASYLVSSYRGRLTPESDEEDILTYSGHELPFLLLNGLKDAVTLIQALTARVDALEVTVTQLQEAGSSKPP